MLTKRLLRECSTRSRTLRNSTSACVSVPSLLRQSPSGDAASQGGQPWVWRTDISASEQYWKNWFTGLSKKFLEAKGGKLLILAGTDRLDKELMIGQMQGDCPNRFRCLNRPKTDADSTSGKYQLRVFPDAGHFVQEDQPAKTAMAVADFYRRNDKSTLVLPPKVGGLLKKQP